VALNHNYEEDGSEVVVEDGGGGRSVVDPAMLEMLKDLRRKVGKLNNLPPYVIFQDLSLEEMATKYPITLEELSHITGVSKGKADRYGKKFIELIAQYVEENEIDRPEDFVLKSIANKAGEKIKIIQAIDKRISLDDLAKSLGIKRAELITELESIVHSGTKMNIDYYLLDIYDEDLLKDVFDYFRSTESDSIDAACDEFSADDIEPENMRLIRLKFMSEMGN
jgi:ATP-dependent DNA helicase RecQ